MATKLEVDRAQRLISQARVNTARAVDLCLLARQTRGLVKELVRREPHRRGARFLRGGSENGSPENGYGPLRRRSSIPPFRLEVDERHYLALLRGVERGSRLANLLVSAVRDERRTRAGVQQDTVYVLKGVRADGLELRRLAAEHAPDLCLLIDKALGLMSEDYRL